MKPLGTVITDDLFPPSRFFTNISRLGAYNLWHVCVIINWKCRSSAANSPDKNLQGGEEQRELPSRTVM